MMQSNLRCILLCATLQCSEALLLLLLSFSLIGCEQKHQPEASKESKTTPPVYEGTIIVLGDSLTAGYGVAEEEAYPALLQEKLHKSGHYWQVINAGVSGETSSGALARIKWIMAQKPDIVILETGANDGLRGIATEVIHTNIKEAVNILQQGNITVILAGMQIVQNLGADYTDAFAALYPSIAKVMHVPLIPFLLKGVAGIPSLNQADTIHPNREGHAIIAGTVFPYVVEALSKALDNR